jgi:hypothetical protein
MTRGVLLALPLLCCPFPAAANDPGQAAYMIRMLSCKGTDANMVFTLLSWADPADRGTSSANRPETRLGATAGWSQAERPGLDRAGSA